MSAATRLAAGSPAIPRRLSVPWGLTVACSLALSGCWKEDLQALPTGSLPFEPALQAPTGWQVSPVPVALTCPDGAPADFHLLHPSAPSERPGPAAVLFHSGAFDFVFSPHANAPLAGPHYAQPSRLDARWSLRQVFATLGMLPAQVPEERHLGGLAVALAERDVPVLLPANCWGDLWHNRRALAQNDFQADLFARDGRTAAEWALQLLADPDFAASLSIELPITTDPEAIYLIGLGEGGRAVAELLALTADSSDEALPPIAGALIDSHRADLSPYYDDPAKHHAILTGLDRIFPGGLPEAEATALHQVPWPSRLGYLYSTDDPSVPAAVHEPILQRMDAHPDGWIYASPGAKPLLLDGQDMDLAHEAVSYLLGP